MLKKKNILKVFFALLFSFVLFGANLTISGSKISFASTITPDINASKEDGTWSVSEGTLSLNGVDWNGALNLENITAINLSSTNKIVAGDEDEGVVLRLNLSNVHISGDGTLELGLMNTESQGFIIEAYNGEIITFEGQCIIQKYVDGDYETIYKYDSSLSFADFVDVNYIKFMPNSIQGSGTSEDHVHEFTYSVSGETLTATCTDSCTLENKSVSASLMTNDISFGEALDYSMDFSAFNTVTLLNLDLNSATKTFYKSETAGAVTGGIEVNGTPSDAGFYYLVATFSGVDGSDLSVVRAFEIVKADVVIAGNDTEIDYQTSAYNIKSLFEIPSYAGTANFEIVSSGTTGAGSIDGENLTISKSGTFIIKVTTSATTNYNEGSATCTLTVNKIDLTGLSINVSSWSEEESGSVELIGNVGGGEVTYTYYTDKELSILTGTSSGASTEGGEPSLAGVYYVKASVAESDNYNSAEVSKEFSIVGNVSVTPVAQTTTIKYNSLDNGEFDISSLFEFVGCDDLTKTYYLVGNQTETKLNSNTYIVTVKSYTFKVVVSSTQDGVIAQSEATLVVEKSNVTINVNHFEWAYGDSPTPIIEGVVPSGAITYNYYYDEEHTQLVDGVPTEVGDYYVIVNVSETGTTNATNTTTTCKITPKTITITWSFNNYTYNGSVQVVSATYKDINGQDVALKVTLNDEFKDAKSYTATASFKDGETSYVLPTEVTKDYTIRKRELTITIVNKTSYYGEELINLTAKVISGEAVYGDELYTLSCDIPESKDMGEYEITGTTTNANYDITFINGKYLIVNKITSLKLSNWTYGETPSTPTSSAYYGEDKIEFTYYDFDGYSSSTAPTEPGRYYVKAVINDDKEYYCAELRDVPFTILKIVVNKPEEDKTTYVYDGQYKTYSIIGDNAHYSVSGAEQRDAGTHKVIVTLNDSVHYRWNSGNLTSLEYIFTIEKKTINKPVGDNRTFKYTGKNQVYLVQDSEDYLVSGHVQSAVGCHLVTVELTDKKNTAWADGSSKDITFEFVIRQSELNAPFTLNAKGETLDSSPVIVTASDEKGVDPNANLNVVVISSNDTSQVKELKTILGDKLTKYETIFKAYDVSLKVGDIETQPEGTITLKLAVPEELLETKFKIYHVHTEEDGQKTISELDFAGANELGYVVVQTDKLSEFIFVYEQNSLSSLVVTFACTSLVLLIILALQLFFYIRLCKKSLKSGSKTALAVAPAMFVSGEVAWSIVLGILSVLLLAGNIVLCVLLIKKLPKKEKKQISNKSDEDSPKETVDMSKVQVLAKLEESKEETKKKKTTAKKEGKTFSKKEKTSKPKQTSKAKN